ncbi:MAG: prenyltransferase/squalene oxidase repeat-containing protein [Planctomycetota bacterium]
MIAALVGWVAPLAAAPQAAQESPELDPLGVPREMGPEEAREALDKSLEFLVTTQREDGSWGSSALEGLAEFGFSVETYYAWQVASHGIATMALLEAEATPEREAALEKAVRWLLDTRMPKRGSNWDTDYTWSGLYGFVACARVASDPRYRNGDLRERLDARGRDFWRILETTEVPSGGWAYYDDPPFAKRPNWATSFCTALVLPAIAAGEELGWVPNERHRDRATDALLRCALPNGAFTYTASNAIPRSGAGESINNVKGSLGRIQVAHWALGTLGDSSITPERIRWGLDQFFEHHKFLDAAYMRPIPHEAYYANAAYFYLFAHYYAAQVIDLLPREEREAYHAKLRPHLIKVQRADGSSVDFLGTSYMVTAGTGYTALALRKGLPVRD